MTARRTIPIALLRDVTARPTIAPPPREAPVPWRAVTLSCGKAAVIAANGNALFTLCDRALAARIVANVNLAECAYRDEAR